MIDHQGKLKRAKQRQSQRPAKKNKSGKRKLPRKIVRANSAGGVVFAKIDGRLKFLIIQHKFNNKWSIPKGYVEPGEATIDAAVREVEEETGIPTDVIDFLDFADIWMTLADHRLHRKLHAYLLKAKTTELDPAKFDPEEGMIGVVEWASPEEALKRIRYKNIRPLLRKAQERLKELGHA
jgi:8-oxo-dGTP pyrophosphatase MutT (NUDIX family)